MSVPPSLHTEALQRALEEADLLARMADAVLAYVADRHHAPHGAGIHHGHAANVECGLHDHDPFADAPAMTAIEAEDALVRQLTVLRGHRRPSLARAPRA